MNCILMIAGGYALLAVAAPCDDDRCYRTPVEAGRILQPNEIPQTPWIQLRGLLACKGK